MRVFILQRNSNQHSAQNNLTQEREVRSSLY